MQTMSQRLRTKHWEKFDVAAETVEKRNAAAAATADAILLSSEFNSVNRLPVVVPTTVALPNTDFGFIYKAACSKATGVVIVFRRN